MKVKHLGQICVGPSISKAEIQKANKVLDKIEEIYEAETFLETLSGETRLKLVLLLQQMKELCVCDMADILGTSVSATSHQLKKLRDTNIVDTRRKSQTIYYSLKDKKKIDNILTTLNLL
ncbi:MAG TPA: ArsR family transcriptional regulator [bacterium]|nr:ArsR family transcriptional regulator [bacterium]